MSACPSDETFTRLVDGLLSDAEVQTLEAHCDGCPTCARVLAELARAVAPEEADWLGARYHLLEPLGAGGMGVVYAAFDDKLGRKVAVKRLRETGLGSSAEKRRARFLREAQLLASLSHPNVLTVFDVGGSDRELYVVVELVDGWPVSRWAAEMHPDWRRIVDIYVQAGRGLAAAHELGIVHRDVKPDNILVARSGRVLVGDFGLAGLTDTVTPIDSPPSAEHPAEPLTQTGAVLGTPAYMSPEQHAGKSGDALSDQFSFCVALYETLHGRRPFSGRTASEIAAAIRDRELVSGSDGVPRAIDRVLAVGLDPVPGRRFASMSALVAALERAGERRPGRTLAVVAAVFLISGGAGLALWPRIFPRHADNAPSPRATTAVQPTGPPAEPRRKAASSAAPNHESTERPATSSPPSHPAAEPQRLLALAGSRAATRDGKSCLAALDEVETWPPDLARRAIELRADCEMLRGNCEKGRKLLEPFYASDRTIADVSKGVLGAHVSRTCLASAFPAVRDRVLAVFLQADVANQSAGKQTRWCGALEKTLLRDTVSAEVQACFAAHAAGAKESAACNELFFDLTEAYRHLSECFLRDGDCREGAALDIMHTQVEARSQEPNGPHASTWCYPETTVERFESCAPEGKAAQRRCLEALEAAQREGAGPLLPKFSH